jgi:hypothetical protein
MSSTNQPVRRYSLPERPERQRHFRGEEREQIMSARQAAEALFTPKTEVPEPTSGLRLPDQAVEGELF